MAQGKISAKQEEILEYIKSQILGVDFHHRSEIFVKQFI